jgi:hypothetical protein
MFGKTTLFKVGFVVVTLAVVGFLAAAPSMARAFFQGEGQTGWVARLLGVSDDAGESKPAEIEAKSVSAAGNAVLMETSRDDSGSTNGTDDNANSNDASNTNGDDNGNVNDNGSDDGMGAEFEFVGTISANEGTTWTVSGILVTVNEMTEMKGMLDLGSLVKVEGKLQADGSVLAREIKLAEDDDQEGYVEFVGELTAKEGSTWMIGGVAVMVTSTTELYSGLEIGAMVKVEGDLVDGQVQAREIKIWSADDDSGNDNDDDRGNDNDDDRGNDNDGDLGNDNDDNGNDNDDKGNDNDDRGNNNDDNGNDNDDRGNDNDDNGNDNDDDRSNDNDDNGNDNDDDDDDGNDNDDDDDD